MVFLRQIDHFERTSKDWSQLWVCSKWCPTRRTIKLRTNCRRTIDSACDTRRPWWSVEACIRKICWESMVVGSWDQSRSLTTACRCHHKTTVCQLRRPISLVPHSPDILTIILAWRESLYVHTRKTYVCFRKGKKSESQYRNKNRRANNESCIVYVSALATCRIALFDKQLK